MGSGKRWSDEEILFLQELWGSKTIPQIAKIMNRSENAIKVKSTRLGLGTFADSSEYMCARKWSDLLGIDCHAITDYWIAKLNLKHRRIAPRGGRKFVYIKCTDMLEFLKSHPDIWDSRRVDLYALGTEPDWLSKKRKQDQASLPARKAQKWTENEDRQLISLFKTGRMTYRQIGERLGRSERAVEHRLSRLDVWGNGCYISDEQKKEAQQRSKENFESKRLYVSLIFVLKKRFNTMNFDGYWQKERCMNWSDINGCLANETSCDECASFRRIQPQGCVRCGCIFFERTANLRCSKCRAARKQAAIKKAAVMAKRRKAK